MSAFRLLDKIRCPAPRRALSLGALLALAACGYIPRPVEGVPSGPPWNALPLKKWLAENRAEPQALSFCAPPACSPGLAVGVVRLKGPDAQVTASLLDDPQRLARALMSNAGRDKPVRTAVSAERLTGTGHAGFLITLAPKDGGKAPAYGAALGRRLGEDLLVVVVVGKAPDAVESTARQVAARELGS